MLPGVLWHLKAHKTLSSTHSFISSHMPSGPGAKPASQEHSNPPFLFVQVPNQIKHQNKIKTFLHEYNL